jgi:hypothetical protein
MKTERYDLGQLATVEKEFPALEFLDVLAMFAYFLHLQGHKTLGDFFQLYNDISRSYPLQLVKSGLLPLVPELPEEDNCQRLAQAQNKVFWWVEDVLVPATDPHLNKKSPAEHILQVRGLWQKWVQQGAREGWLPYDRRAILNKAATALKMAKPGLFTWANQEEAREEAASELAAKMLEGASVPPEVRGNVRGLRDVLEETSHKRKTDNELRKLTKPMPDVPLAGPAEQTVDSLAHLREYQEAVGLLGSHFEKEGGAVAAAWEYVDRRPGSRRDVARKYRATPKQLLRAEERVVRPALEALKKKFAV